MLSFFDYMYFFSNKYIQINNSTKTKIRIFMDIVPLTLVFVLLALRHFEAKSLVSASFLVSESVPFSFEKRG